MKSLRKSVIALGIFALLAFAVWAGVIATFTILPNANVPGFLQFHLNQTVDMLALPFLGGFGPATKYFGLALGVIAITGLIVLFLFFTVLFSALKKRGVMIFPMIVFALSAVASAEVTANLSTYSVADQTNALGYLALLRLGSSNIIATVMAVLAIVFGYLAGVLALLAIILSIPCTFMKKDSKDEEVLFAEEPEPEEEKEPELTAEAIRGMIRDELRGCNHGSVTGATFAGPLVVQYFNGPAPCQPAPQPQPEPKPEPAPYIEEVAVPEPYVEPEPEKVEEPAPVEPEPQPEPEPEPQPEPVQEEPAPVEPAPEPQPEVVVPVVEAQPEPAPEKKPIIRIPFEERMVKAEKEMKDNYNEIKNEILSYGVKSRISNSGDTFRLHRKTYVKITIAGKSLKLYFALDPKDYRDTTIPVNDAGEKGIYEEIPLVFKVKSGLSVKRCKQLIADVMEKDNLTQGEIGKVNWVKEIQASLREAKKAAKEAEAEE